MNSRYQVLDSGFQSLSGFWTPWAEFRILKPRIPESTGKNLTDSGIWINNNIIIINNNGIYIALIHRCSKRLIPLQGAKYHLLSLFYKNEYQDLEVSELFLLKPKKASYMLSVYYHRFRWYATFQIKTPAETFPKFPSIMRVIDRSDRNPPITTTSVTFWRSLRHTSGLWLTLVLRPMQGSPDSGVPEIYDPGIRNP